MVRVPSRQRGCKTHCQPVARLEASRATEGNKGMPSTRCAGVQKNHPFRGMECHAPTGRVTSIGKNHRDFAQHESKAKVVESCVTGRIIRDTDLSLRWEELKRRRRVPVVAMHADRAVTCNFRFAVVRHDLVQIGGGETILGFKELFKPCVATIRRFVNWQASQNTR